MTRTFASLFVVALLTACATSPVPKDYAGPTATIYDSAVSEGSSKARFFYLAAVNDQRITDSLSHTRSVNKGRGAYFAPAVLDRKVPARPLKLKLKAQVAYGAPILEIIHMRQMYSAEQVVQFEPKPDAIYVVRGELSAEKSSVWIEDSRTGERVGTALTATK